MMTDLRRVPIFLSASFPTGERGEHFARATASGITDAVAAFAHAVLGSNGILVFGGHPTITPLVLMVARELRVAPSVALFQSEWFRDRQPPEVAEIVAERLGTVHWTPREHDLPDSLLTMRTTMIESAPYAGGLFIGGMEGIADEYCLMKDRWPDTPCIPIAGAGGAAAGLPTEDCERLGLQTLHTSRAYPLLASQFVDALEAKA